MISIAPSRDWKLLRSIATHPKVYKYLTDDNCPAPEDFVFPENSPNLFVLATHHDKPIGFWMLDISGTEYEVHTAMLPEARGPLAHEAAQSLLIWLWSETDCMTLKTKVPAYNRLALAYAKAAGMRECGILPKSYLRNGIMVDQIMLDIGRPDCR
jgi:RimJ/RimL family protein N-acetyltransferase